MNEAAEVIEEVENLPAIDLGVNEKSIMVVTEKYKDLIVTDSATRKSTASARFELVQMRESIKKARLKLTRPLDAKKKEITGHQNKLLALIEPAEDRLTESITAFDKIEQDRIAEEERIEQERIDNIKSNIEMSFGFSATANLNGASIEQLKMSITHAKSAIIDDCFGALQNEAINKRAIFVSQVETMLHDALLKEREEVRLKAQAERFAEEKAELDRQRAEQMAKELALEEDRKKLEAAENKRITDAVNEDISIKNKQNAEQKKLDDERAAFEAEKAEVEAAKQRAKDQEQFEREAKERAEQEAKDKIERELLAKQEAEVANKLEKARQAALAPDRDKLILFANKISEIELPEVSNIESKAVIQMIIYSITMLSKDIIDKCDKL